MNSEISFTFDQVKCFIHRGEEFLTKLEVDYCCPKMILPALMGVRKKKIFHSLCAFYFVVCVQLNCAFLLQVM